MVFMPPKYEPDTTMVLDVPPELADVVVAETEPEKEGHTSACPLPGLLPLIPPVPLPGIHHDGWLCAFTPEGLTKYDPKRAMTPTPTRSAIKKYFFFILLCYVAYGYF